MRPVTKRLVAGVLAGAPRDGPGLGDLDLFRPERSPLVRAVAEWLIGGTATGAPPIGAGLDRLNDGSALGDVRFVHGNQFTKTGSGFISVPVGGGF